MKTANPVHGSAVFLCLVLLNLCDSKYWNLVYIGNQIRQNWVINNAVPSREPNQE